MWKEQWGKGPGRARGKVWTLEKGELQPEINRYFPYEKKILKKRAGHSLKGLLELGQYPSAKRLLRTEENMDSEKGGAGPIMEDCRKRS